VLPALWEQWRAHGDEKWHGGDLTAFIARCSFYSPNPSGACGEGGAGTVVATVGSGRCDDHAACEHGRAPSGDG
jgi:hypothetical protein